MGGWSDATPQLTLGTLFQLPPGEMRCGCKRSFMDNRVCSDGPNQTNKQTNKQALPTDQFSSRWYLCARKNPYALNPVSQKFSQRRLRNGSNVRLIDDGPPSSFQRRSSSDSSFHAYLLQAIDGVMSLVLCPLVVSANKNSPVRVSLIFPPQMKMFSRSCTTDGLFPKKRKQEGGFCVVMTVSLS